MTDKRELTFSEQFHRLKRTSLVLSSAVIASFIPGINVGTGLGLTGLSLAGVNPDLARALLYLTACYYFAGFLFEFSHERVAHSGTTAMSGLGELNARARQLADEVRRGTDAFEGWKNTRSRIVRDAEESAERYVQQGANLVTAPELVSKNVSLRKMDESAFLSLQNSLYHLNALNTQLRHFEIRSRLMHWLHLFGWELAGAVTPWLLGSYLVFAKLHGGEIVAALTRMFSIN